MHTYPLLWLVLSGSLLIASGEQVGCYDVSHVSFFLVALSLSQLERQAEKLFSRFSSSLSCSLATLILLLCPLAFFLVLKPLPRSSTTFLLSASFIDTPREPRFFTFSPREKLPCY